MVPELVPVRRFEVSEREAAPAQAQARETAPPPGLEAGAPAAVLPVQAPEAERPGARPAARQVVPRMSDRSPPTAR